MNGSQWLVRVKCKGWVGRVGGWARPYRAFLKQRGLEDPDAGQLLH